MFPPPPQGNNIQTQGSSPSKVSKSFAVHLRHEVHRFALGKVERETNETLRNYLEKGGIIPRRDPTHELPKFSFGDFLKPANKLSKAVETKHFPKSELLVFEDTGKTIPWGNVTDTKCRPDYGVALKSHWRDKRTMWPCLRCVGEKASEGKAKTDQQKQALTYLFYLLLSRPDLHVAQGFLTTERTFTFYLGIGGLGVHGWEVEWEAVPELMYPFIYRLYDPGSFADTSYVHMVPDFNELTAAYTIRLAMENGSGVDIGGFKQITASSPFGTRTHVLSNPECKIETEESKVVPLSVIKDQLCHSTLRSTESYLLERIHSGGSVPGVVTVSYSGEVPNKFVAGRKESSSTKESVKEGSNKGSEEGRKKYRLGMQEKGHPFMLIDNLQTILEVVYDTLEVLRYLRLKRDILHRDISIGNILFVNSDPLGTINQDEDVMGPDGQPKDFSNDLCFVKFLLQDETSRTGPRGIHPRHTSALLIDFNRGEHINPEDESQRGFKTGTPAFISRSVEKNGPIEIKRRTLLLPEKLVCRESYSKWLPLRSANYPDIGTETLKEPDTEPWRHELDHDAESVFWVLLYWTVTACPSAAPGKPKVIPLRAWNVFQGSCDTRDDFIKSDVSHKTIFHSDYEGLAPLTEDLAEVLRFDRSWFPAGHKRKRIEYVGDAFQRLILAFLLKNKGQPFMEEKVDIRRNRPVEGASTSQNLRSVKTQQSDSAGLANSRPSNPGHLWTTTSLPTGSKRPSPSPQPIEEERELKRLRISESSGSDQEEGNENVDLEGAE